MRKYLLLATLLTLPLSAAGDVQIGYVFDICSEDGENGDEIVNAYCNDRASYHQCDEAETGSWVDKKDPQYKRYSEFRWCGKVNIRLCGTTVYGDVGEDFFICFNSQALCNVIAKRYCNSEYKSPIPGSLTPENINFCSINTSVYIDEGIKDQIDCCSKATCTGYSNTDSAASNFPEGSSFFKAKECKSGGSCGEHSTYGLGKCKQGYFGTQESITVSTNPLGLLKQLNCTSCVDYTGEADATTKTDGSKGVESCYVPKGHEAENETGYYEITGDCNYTP